MGVVDGYSLSLRGQVMDFAKHNELLAFETFCSLMWVAFYEYYDRQNDETKKRMRKVVMDKLKER